MNQAGVNRYYDRSSPQKVVFFILHTLILMTCAWLVYFNGLPIIGGLFGEHWQFSDSNRADILFVCIVVYWLRQNITLFYLLARRIDYSEVFGLVIFFALFEIGFVLLGGGAFSDGVIVVGWVDAIALFLLLVGSFLNSFSEIQRKWWKQGIGNKGHCYTGGLFSHSMHINYFGDIVLFTGWSLFTYSLWALMLPILMTVMFVFIHIPALDAYLADRYGEGFTNYSKKTKKLVPFVY